MTKVFERSDSPVLAGTHALLIGVGAYPHLIAGGKDLVDDPMGLGQLSSPPISALAFCAWLLGREGPIVGQFGFSNPEAPLASVEMLLSPAGDYSLPDGSTVAVNNATKENIDKAFEAWRQRVTAHPNSIGVFYFCGHGIMAATHHLLAADFGDNPGNPWSKAFDLSSTIRALEREVSGPLYFFIDACRQIPKSFAATLGANPLALRVVQLNKPVVNTSRLVLHATGEGALAFAVAAKVSRFTDALVRSLSGYAGKKIAGKQLWEVNGEELPRAVRHILDNGNKSIERRQLVEQELTRPTTFHVEAISPKVAVNLDLVPETRRQEYLLYLASLKGQRQESSASCCPWRVEVPSGFYDLGAVVAETGAVTTLCENEQLEPPYFSYLFEVET